MAKLRSSGADPNTATPVAATRIDFLIGTSSSAASSIQGGRGQLRSWKEVPRAFTPRNKLERSGAAESVESPPTLRSLPACDDGGFGRLRGVAPRPAIARLSKGGRRCTSSKLQRSFGPCSFGASQLASGTPLSAGALPLSENVEMSMISNLTASQRERYAYYGRAARTSLELSDKVHD